MNDRNTFLYKNISHFILVRDPQFVVSLEIDGETQIGDFFLSHIFFWEPGGANACTPMRAVSSERPLIGCMSHAQLPFSALSKSDPVVLITWSPSGYTPVVPDCSDHAALFTNHVTACQSTWGHKERTEKPCHVI